MSQYHFLTVDVYQTIQVRGKALERWWPEEEGDNENDDAAVQLGVLDEQRVQQ